jgi:monoamine oxidase
MGQGASVAPAARRGLHRRRLVQAAAAWPLAACAPAPAPLPQGGWIGAAHERGHALRQSRPPEEDQAGQAAQATPRRASVLVLGGGIAGLAAARGFARAGVDDVHLLELEDDPGGNSRGHAMAGMACPRGAHYLPQPQAPAHEVVEWLHEIGLLRHDARGTVADERHLCHAPQERLWFEGAWHEGLLPPADPGSATMAQYRRFARAVAAAPHFAIPSHRVPWSAAHDALDRQSFAAWLDGQGLSDARLRWALDYACRDDYGAGPDEVSAWAGLHYFGSRHGFHAPGDAQDPPQPVFTWPEGNAWLVRRLAQPLSGRVHGGRVVLRVREQRHGVQVLARHGRTLETWSAGTVVIALPLFVAARVLDAPPQALLQAAAATAYAPWLVANLQLEGPLRARPGVPPAWDNVRYGGAMLGYVDAMHQSLRPVTGATVLTAYAALPARARPELLAPAWAPWAERVLSELAPLHPDLRQRMQRIDLQRWGHAMAIPRPGRQASAAARAALRGGSGRVRFAHSDLAGYSIFEEAFIAGCEAAAAPCRCA